MSDKQRADHIQAKYWNGFLTRTEAQSVFNETAGVVQSQGIAIQKLDAVISFMAEKFGITGPEIEAWVAKKIEQSNTKQPACASVEAGIVCGEPESAHTPEAARGDVGMDHKFVEGTWDAEESKLVVA